MCAEFGEVTVIIGLVINFLAFVSPLLSFRDTLSYRNRSAGQNISQYIECTRQDKIYIAIYRMHSGGSDQTMNILVYIPTHHSEFEKKKKNGRSK